MNENNANFTPVAPNFKTLVRMSFQGLTNFPYIEEDFDALTNYGLLSKVVEYLNQVISNNNEQNTVITNLYNAYVSLENYINNYFDNLDVQDEINNKLDEMVTDGTLSTIINQEIFGEINSRLNLLSNKKYIFIGDSYLQGYTPDGFITGWGSVIVDYLELSSTEYTIKCRGGYGFAAPTGTFTELLNELTSDNDVTDIIVAGGFNDMSGNKTQQDVLSGMTSFKILATTKFPNARIHVAFIGGSNLPQYIYKLNEMKIIYQQCINAIGCDIYNNTEYSLKNYSFFSSDGYHPNQNGQYSIAKNILNCMINGSCDNSLNWKKITLTPSGDCTSITGNTDGLGCVVCNEITTISSQTLLNFNFSTPISYTANMESSIELATISNSYLVGCQYKTNNTQVSCYIQDGNSYYKVSANLYVYNGKLYINILDINDSNSNFRTFSSISKIVVQSFTATFPSALC